MKKTIVIAMLTACLFTAAACNPNPEIKPTPSPARLSAAPTATVSPRQILEYRLDSSRQNPGGDTYPQPDETFVQKVNEIFALCAHPQNDVFENVLGLYQYVSQNIAFKEDGASDAAGAIVSGTANQSGYARAFQFLLNQIGMESYIAVSNDGTKTWVMANMPDGFYHFDAAEEARQTQGQSLQFFAMNDGQRWDGGKIDGWYALTDQAGGRYDPPKNEKQTYWFTRNIKAGYGVDVANDSLYFADVSQDNELVRYYYQTGVEEALYGKRAGSMVFHRGMLYYSDLNQRNQLFKMDVSTGQTELLDSVFVTRMMIKNGNLIYFDDVSSSEKGIPLG